LGGPPSSQPNCQESIRLRSTYVVGNHKKGSIVGTGLHASKSLELHSARCVVRRS
ncbi:hypothetical protein BDF21DRAFT_348470, partial [Thamnidium elegans]